MSDATTDPVHYDLIIVGGGPAGSTLATVLAERGWRVLILDKAAFPRDKTCAGWVTPEVLTTLGITSEAYARDGRVLQPIHRFSIGLMGQAPCVNDHGGAPVSYGIRRCEFDHYLLARASVEKVLGESVNDLTHEHGEWCVNGRYQAPWLVGAGGHFCPVARLLGDGPGKHELAVTAKEVEFRLQPEQVAACAVAGDCPELWFCRDLKGYAWVFRKGDYLNIGLGREDNHRLTEHLGEFVAMMQRTGRLPESLPERYKGHAYLLYGHARRPLVAPGVCLIGDAAGLAYTQSGEGIRPAVESALLAASALEEASPGTTLYGYEAAVRKRFGVRGDEKRAPVPLPDWVRDTLVGPLMRSHWFTRKVVTERWFLHRQVPAMQREKAG
ncbi:NAD(P)/FAD-dependent oxidoreductase [Alcanivorax sp. JB21]|uniref:NAD(P)/FAD-dependent oxidoreductase n=1 Tax=Alcanivorax limicola TaxID=2874102 RepID=UPI001CBB4B5A|nr:NAD(P)/FAD-dependent oxidoreductase [Alcanivorax limicola]MBZ2188616.1 NAD(P)/FAD-dependent oxidoreductase [Alcanivorax limicola]